MSGSSFFVAGTALTTIVAPIATVQTSHAWQFHADHVLGTSLDVTVAAEDPHTASAAARAARAEIKRLDAYFSDWRTDSELATLNRAEAARLSPPMADLLARAAYWRTATDGAFDERLGVVSALWRDAMEGGPGPDPEEIRRALRAAQVPIGQATAQETFYRPAGVRFGLDGLAKGMIIDAAMDSALRAAPTAHGIMIDIGGDIRCWGNAPGRAGWLVGVADPCAPADNADPIALIELRNQAIATSGRGNRDLRLADGVAPHVLDPRTGMPVPHVLGATVVADRAADADALSTALIVLPPEQGLAMIDQRPNTAAHLVAAGGLQSASELWDRLKSAAGNARTQMSGPPRAAERQTGPAWPSGFRVDVSYEVPAIKTARYRRPYLAIWITDERDRVVRTLLLLGRRPAYANANYLWWGSYGPEARTKLAAVSRATRAPGRYTAIWDGRDDQGRPVPQGRYRLHVEAARQFGGHAHSVSDLNLRATPLTQAIAAKREFGAVRARYGRPQ